MKNIEEGLRRRIGSDHLLGCYTIKENGKALYGLFWKKTGLHTGLTVMQADKKKRQKFAAC